MPEMFCPSCRKATLVIREPVYQGFTKVGERVKCAVCGHVFPAPSAPVDAPPVRKRPSLFGEELAPPPKLFAEEEAARLCRHCIHYTVNPFRQWCGLHRKDVEATDTCRQFEARPEPAEGDHD
jgi:hypothetical protein